MFLVLVLFMATILTLTCMEGALYVLNCGFCPLLKKSKGNPYLKILD